MGDQVKFFKNRPKSSPCLKGTKALWRKLNYSLNKMHLKCKRLENIFAQTAALKVYEWASYGNYRKVTQNSHFLKKCKRGDNAKFFKNRLRSWARLKGPKALARKWHYPLISMLLKCKDWKRFRCKQRLQRCPNGQVMAIFGRSPKTRIF